MSFVFENRASDSPLVESIWQTRSTQAGSFISSASTQFEMVIAHYKGKTTFTVRGPETRATPAPVPEEAEFFGIIFKLGTFMPPFPAKTIMDRRDLFLPHASDQSVWLHGAAWQIPNFDNADTFIARLVRQGLLAYDPVVEIALQGRSMDLSVRSMQRRFVRATGLTQGAILQINRAHQAMALLQQGVSILDTVVQAGYADQPHLTRSLRHFMGQTPAQVLSLRSTE